MLSLSFRWQEWAKEDVPFSLTCFSRLFFFSSFLRINFPQLAFLSGYVMLSLTKDLTSEQPVATAHSTRNTRYQLYIIPNANFFCVIVSYSFVFSLLFFCLLLFRGSLKMTVVFFPFTLIFLLLHICFLGTYSTYLSRKLPSGRLCEQKKDILRSDGKRRAEESPDLSVRRMCKLKVRTTLPV